MIDYPYLPEGRSFRFVPEGDLFLEEARRARQEYSGDPLFPIGVVAVKDGEVVLRAGNGYNRGAGVTHVCPRVVKECPSGTGYELCDLHDSPGHAEAMLIAEAQEQGVDLAGADVYMYGHWWCCEPCWNKMITAGIKDVYLPEAAHELFTRERVQGETLVPSVKQIFFSHAFVRGDVEQLKIMLDLLDGMCGEFGCSTVIPFRDGVAYERMHEHTHDLFYRWSEECITACDLVITEVSDPTFGVGGELVMAERAGKPIVLISKNGARVSEFVTGNPAVVYHVQYDSLEEVVRQVRQVIRQL